MIAHDVGMAHEAPASLADAYNRLDEMGTAAKIVAGDQSLKLLIRQGLIDAEAVVDITAIDELAGIQTDEESVRIGTTCTYKELVDHYVTTEFPTIGDAIAVIADRQVRSMGTIGGALSYANSSLDITPALLCLDAKVIVGSSEGSRTTDLTEFFRGYMSSDLRPNELVEVITFERNGGQPVGSAFLKHSKIKGGWPTVGAGARSTRRGRRLNRGLLGGVSRGGRHGGARALC